MLTVHFDRMAEHATYQGIRCHGSDPYFDICRQLTDRGWWDDAATFIDERGMPCLTVRSIHSCARRYRPNEADRAAKAARIEARKAAP